MEHKPLMEGEDVINGKGDPWDSDSSEEELTCKQRSLNCLYALKPSPCKCVLRALSTVQARGQWVDIYVCCSSYSCWGASLLLPYFMGYLICDSR
jgi:hypothetical protein